MEPVVPWYLGGPAFGLLVATLYLVTNRRLGVSGSYLHLAKALTGRRGVESWRLWFLGGLLAGAGIAAAAAGRFGQGGYGTLGEALSYPALGVVLTVAGVLIGYGARYAGGCTSGHGITGCSSLSGGSMVTTGVFFTTAVAVTWVLYLATGGAW